MIKTLYVHRPLLNANDLIDWATRQGFPSVLEPDDMHTTIAFSKKAFPWDRLKPLDDTIKVVHGPRAVIPLGDKGATVLRFEHPDLHKRWKEILDAGASWEHDGYHPHVSISYTPHNLDLEDIEPFTGPLIFGPEIFAPVVEDWDKKISEIPTDDLKDGVLEGKRSRPVKYFESITETTIMNESLASLLMNNIDTIMEAFNVDESGNLVVVNKKKVAESDEIFHEYFVKHMNRMYRTLTENDPLVMDPTNNMHQPGVDHGMHAMGHPGMGQPEGMGMGGEQMHDEMGGPGGDVHMGDMAMDDMHMHGMHPMHQHQFDPNGQFESAEPDEYEQLFGENTDLEINELFGLTEDDDESEDEDGEELHEFMDEQPDDQSDFLPDGGMDLEGGHNDFGGDMGGMDLDSGQDHHDDMGMGGDDDMVTIHGQTDNGGEFEFSFDKDALDFDDLGDEGGDDSGDMGGMDDMGGDAGHSMDQPGMGGEEDHDDNPMEAAQHFHNGKPGRGNKGPRTSRMAVVPASPKAAHAAPFPTPQGQRQRKK